MTNRLALILGIMILGFFALDALVLDWESHIHLMRRLADLIRFLAFWR